MTAPGAETASNHRSLDPTGLADEVAELLLRPACFFRALPERRLGRLWVVLVVVAGCAAVADRIDERLLVADLFPGRSDPRLAAVADDWKVYWSGVALGGLFAAVPAYWIAGWWLGIRARWSGAAQVDWRRARRIAVFSTAVWAAPRLVWGGVETMWFPSYRAAFSSDEFQQLFLIAALLWSVLVSYRGITATHAVRRGRAIFWLVALPLAFYLVIFGGALGSVLWPLASAP